MGNTFKKKLTGKFPRNFIISHPLYGALLVAAFTTIFAILYRPLGAHAGRFMGYELTMAVYAMIAAASFFLYIKILSRLTYFSTRAQWSLLKEILAIIIILTGTGIVIFLTAFIMEEPADRWNLPTFLDSVLTTFLVGILPFLFFTAVNYIRHTAPEEKAHHESAEIINHEREEPLQITSRLKKESLSFMPDHLVYAESESNYVNFYIISGNRIQKSVIRNSITEIEKQLAHIPYLVRTHRAYIVNLNKIRSRKGNSLGYRLKLLGIDEEIPVSRNKTHHFSKLFSQHS